MQVIITELKEPINDELRCLIEKKLDRFDGFFGKNTVANVKTTIEKNLECLEITVHHEGRVYRAESISEDINKSLDIALDLLVRNIEKNKTKLKKFRKDSTINIETVAGFNDEEEQNSETSPYVVTKRKTFPIKPMSIEEAILQMNLVGHQFFMFRDQETNEINVVYKRKNNTYGLIEPGD